jgi:putative transposase
VRVFCQDESRFGLLPITRRRLTLRGVKPVSHVQQVFESSYLYGAVEPTTGASCFLELPHLDAACFQLFLDHLAAQYPASRNILLLDNGAFHKAKTLHLPANVLLLFLPPYSPELNPIERVWQHLKAPLADALFPTLRKLRNRVTTLLHGCSPTRLQSLTGYPYFTNAVHGLLLS